MLRVPVIESAHIEIREGRDVEITTIALLHTARGRGGCCCRCRERGVGRPHGCPYNTPQAPMLTPLAAAHRSALRTTRASPGRRQAYGGYMFKSIPDGVSVLPTRQRPRRRLRQPRDVDRAVPVQPAAGLAARGEPERLHELRAQPARDPGPSADVRDQGALEGDHERSRTSSASARTTSRPLPRASSSRSSSRTRRRRTGSSAAERLAGPELHHARHSRRGAGRRRRRVQPVKNGRRRPIYGMGRHNHENSVAIPGFDEARRALGRRHVPDERAGVVAAVHVHGG